MKKIYVSTLKRLSKINKEETLNKIKDSLLSFEKDIQEKNNYIKNYIESYKLLEDYKDKLIDTLENNKLTSFTITEGNKSYQYTLMIPFNVEIDNSLIFTLLFEQLYPIYQTLNYPALIDKINSKFDITEKTITFVYDPDKKDIFLLARLNLKEGELFDIIDSVCKKIQEIL